MSTPNRNAYQSQRLVLWIFGTAVMLVIGTLVVMVFAAAGAPHGPTELPIPQPAPVGP